jgi:exopolyphosphatase/guanosine-5'-triphosphate,3'-diphosphate pyrophosphatase
VRVAAIDVGTNTVRLLVSEDGRDVRRSMEITRLGQGVDAARRLRADAIARTAQAVETFAARARELGAERVRVAGTSALRDAANTAQFVHAVGDIEILSGADEGRLSFLGATTSLDGGPFVVCDIGGGSTELVREGAAMSVDVGSVRIRERCLVSDPPSPEEIERARSTIRAALAPVDIVTGRETLVGVAGTVTQLAALVLGLQEYDPVRTHHSVLRSATVREWTHRLLQLPVAGVRALPAMHPGRADVMASGVVVLDEVMSRWGFAAVLVSERDILDGLVLDIVRPIA